ncbi:nucleotide exchange factor GrpE [Thermosulfurimonas sp. F29]|uniref:nucleotide exchange factor GrpE n=1 Tax=Thermosulfurimonas sp. F29 TaxID=2867247 RepID=UPI001C82E8E2|nr:nucleotide exchange factor GrpE [Thermosulfurimonas sp. F29]MBX6422274.1 nucleotide exchange factor GrpE [Thermosulfurimonas sp. F29]
MIPVEEKPEKTETAEKTPEEGVREEKIEVPREEWERLQEEVKTWKERALRYAAEVENLKKTFKREKEEFYRYALENVFRELLPSVDNLERALEAAEKSGEARSLVEGVALTLKGLISAMEKFGLTQFEVALGEAFNPHHHEALHVEETEEHPEGTVVRVYQKGYRLHDRVLRPALVAVAKRPATRQENNSGEEVKENGG